MWRKAEGRAVRAARLTADQFTFSPVVANSTVHRKSPFCSSPSPRDCPIRRRGLDVAPGTLHNPCIGFCRGHKGIAMKTRRVSVVGRIVALALLIYGPRGP